MHPTAYSTSVLATGPPWGEVARKTVPAASEAVLDGLRRADGDFSGGGAAAGQRTEVDCDGRRAPQTARLGMASDKRVEKDVCEGAEEQAAGRAVSTESAQAEGAGGGGSMAAGRRRR